MSDREKCIAIFENFLENLSEDQMSFAAERLQFTLNEFAERAAREEAEDDAFCEKLLQDYLKDPDPEKGQTVSLEEAAKVLGISL